MNGKFIDLGWNSQLQRHRIVEPRLGAVPKSEKGPKLRGRGNDVWHRGR